MEWVDIATRIGGTAGFFVLLVYAFNQVRSRDGEWKEILEAKEAENIRLRGEVAELRRQIRRR